MGKQLGIINVRGKVGDMGYFKTADGYMIRRNTSVTKDRIASDPKFENTRLVNREFATAGKAGKLLRAAVTEQLMTNGDGKLASRLVKIMMDALKYDTVSDRGDRAPWKGDLAFLEGLEFNKNNEMLQTFIAEQTHSVDRPSGKMTLDVGPFNVKRKLVIPPNAQFFQIAIGGSAIDWENGKCEFKEDLTDYMPVGNVDIPGFSLTVNVTPASTLPLMLVWGVRFFYKTNGKYYQLNGAANNALRVLKVDQP